MHITEAPKPIQECAFVGDIYGRQPAARIVLSGLPPTVNHAYRRRGGYGMYMTKDAKAWKEQAIWECKTYYRKQKPLEDNLAVLIIFMVKSRGKWDIDNRLKSLLDALTGAGIWVDDRQIMHITAHIETHGELSEPETRIFVWTLPKGGKKHGA